MLCTGNEKCFTNENDVWLKIENSKALKKQPFCHCNEYSRIMRQDRELLLRKKNGSNNYRKLCNARQSTERNNNSLEPCRMYVNEGT